jgi:hypothetical protein
MKENNKKFKTIPLPQKKKKRKKKSLEFLIKCFLCYIVTATQAPNQQNLVISPKFDTLTLTCVNHIIDNFQFVSICTRILI